jgi:hypothetical protein
VAYFDDQPAKWHSGVGAALYSAGNGCDETSREASFLGDAGASDADLEPRARTSSPTLAEHLRQLQEFVSTRLLQRRAETVRSNATTPVARSRASDHFAAPPASSPLGALASSSTLDLVRTWLPLLNLATGGRCLFVGGKQEAREGAAMFFAWLAGRHESELRRPRLRGKLATGLRECLFGPLADPSMLRRAESGRLGSARDSMMPSTRGARALLLPKLALSEANGQPTDARGPGEGRPGIWHDASFLDLCGQTPWFIAAGDDSRRSTGRLLESFDDRIDLVVDIQGFADAMLATFAQAVDRKEKVEFSGLELLRLSSSELDAMQRQAASVHVPGPLRRALGLFADWLDGELARACNEASSGNGEAPIAEGEEIVPASVWNRVLALSMALAWINGRDQVTANELRIILALTLPGMLALVSRRRGGIGLVDFTVPGALEPWIDRAFERTLAAYESIWGGGRRDLWLELAAEAEIGEVAQHSRIVRHRLAEVKAVLAAIAQDTAHADELCGEKRRLLALEASLLARL